LSRDVGDRRRGRDRQEEEESEECAHARIVQLGIRRKAQGSNKQ
jgi:hypothetical protein